MDKAEMYIVNCSAAQGKYRVGRFWTFGSGQALLTPEQLEGLQSDPAFTVTALSELTENAELDAETQIMSLFERLDAGQRRIVAIWMLSQFETAELKDLLPSTPPSGSKEAKPSTPPSGSKAKSEAKPAAASVTGLPKDFPHAEKLKNETLETLTAKHQAGALITIEGVSAVEAGAIAEALEKLGG